MRTFTCRSTFLYDAFLWLRAPACVQGEEWEQHEEVHRWAEVPGHETGQGEGETQKGNEKKSIQIDLGAINIFSE